MDDGEGAEERGGRGYVNNHLSFLQTGVKKVWAISCENCLLISFTNQGCYFLYVFHS